MLYRRMTALLDPTDQEAPVEQILETRNGLEKRCRSAREFVDCHPHRGRASHVKEIDRDRKRFNDIVRGKIRENLRKYVTHGEMIGRKGKDLVSIPLPQLDVPHFKYGKNGNSGVGQGDGDEGDPVGKDPADGGTGEAGSEPGSGYLLEVELSLIELADILGEELELPNIEPKGDANIVQEKHRYNSIRRVGPESLKHFKRTYVAALRRQIATGTYDPHRPRVVPIRDDKRYRSWSTIDQPESKAAIIYMMDVSGSMTDEKRKSYGPKLFGSTFGCKGNTTAWNDVISFMMRWRKKSTNTPFITRGKAVGHVSVQPS